MIDVSYIHAKDSINNYLNVTNEDLVYIESQLDNLLFYEKKIDGILFIEGADSDDVKVLTESGSSIIKSIGDRILSMIKRIRDFINDKIQKVKDLFWNKKGTIEKIKAEVNEDPAKASKKIYNLVSEGKLKVDDFRSLAGYYKEIDAVLAQLDKDTVDPESLKAKINNAEEKFNKAKKVFITGAEIAGAAITVHKFIQIFQKTNMNKEARSVDDLKDSAEVELDKIKNITNSLNDKKNEKDLKKCRSKASVLAHAASSIEKVNHGCVSRRTGAISSLWGMADKVLSVIHGGNKDALENTKKDYNKRLKAVTNRVDNLRADKKASADATKPTSDKKDTNINVYNTIKVPEGKSKGGKGKGGGSN